MKTAIRGILFGVLFSVLGFWGPLALVLAQDKPVVPKPAATDTAKPAPAFAALDSKDLTIALLQQELAKQAYEKAQARVQELVAKATKPGYTITQGPDGAFAYAPVEPVKK